MRPASSAFQHGEGADDRYKREEAADVVARGTAFLRAGVLHLLLDSICYAGLVAASRGSQTFTLSKVISVELSIAALEGSKLSVVREARSGARNFPAILPLGNQSA